jgi:hypothetical protein
MNMTGIEFDFVLAAVVMVVVAVVMAQIHQY